MKNKVQKTRLDVDSFRLKLYYTNNHANRQQQINANFSLVKSCFWKNHSYVGKGNKNRPNMKALL